MEQITIRRIFPKESPTLYSQVLDLRNKILFQPIGCDLYEEDLTQEVEDHHVVLAAMTKLTPEMCENNLNSLDEMRVIGCLLLCPVAGDEKSFKLRQMAVSPNFQGKGLGSKLLQKAEEIAKTEHGKTRIFLHGRVHVVGFYSKHGYSQITDKEFLEVGIPHHKMEKIL